MKKLYKPQLELIKKKRSPSPSLNPQIPIEAEISTNGVGRAIEVENKKQTPEKFHPVPSYKKHFQKNKKRSLPKHKISANLPSTSIEFFKALPTTLDFTFYCLLN